MKKMRTEMKMLKHMLETKASSVYPKSQGDRKSHGD